MKKFILILVAILVLAGAATGTAFLVDDQLQFKISGDYEMFDLQGELAPDFEAQLVGEDRNVTLQSLRGKPTVFVFFASFCPHCKAQMPETIELIEAVGDSANVFAVNGRENARLPIAHRERLVTEYLTENEWTQIPTLIAPVEMQEAFKLSAIPSVVVLDQDGRVDYVGLANHDSERLIDLVEDLL